MIANVARCAVVIILAMLVFETGHRCARRGHRVWGKGFKGHAQDELLMLAILAIFLALLVVR